MDRCAPGIDVDLTISLLIPKRGCEEMGIRDRDIPGIEGAEQTEQGRFKLDFRESPPEKASFWESFGLKELKLSPETFPGSVWCF